MTKQRIFREMFVVEPIGSGWVVFNEKKVQLVYTGRLLLFEKEYMNQHQEYVNKRIFLVKVFISKTKLVLGLLILGVFFVLIVQKSLIYLEIQYRLYHLVQDGLLFNSIPTFASKRLFLYEDKAYFEFDLAHPIVSPKLLKLITTKPRFTTN